MNGKCRICGATDMESPIELRETMFGVGERFLYQRCRECGCLQIVEQPANMSQFYPDNYYSYASLGESGLKSIKNRARDILSLYGPEQLFAGREWWENGALKSLRDLGVSRSIRILDIGCGNGSLIARLANVGFTNVLGADPYIANDLTLSNGVSVLKREADDIEGDFDLVMMHHSLEHIWDQQQIARNLARLVGQGGHCLIRIPTIDCWAWEEYGTDWIALDPPRHFYLHSRESIGRLLRGVGFEIIKIVDDSSKLQILGSEKIRRGYPLLDSTGELDYEKFLPEDMIKTAPLRTRDLNRASKGDAIAVHARKL